VRHSRFHKVECLYRTLANTSVWFSKGLPLVNLHIIPFSTSIVFLGDAVYGQSAGQLTEVVQASTTTSTTTTTTTTTLPPIALVDIYQARSSYTVKSPAPFTFDTRVTGSDPGNPYPTGTVTIDVDGAMPPGCGTVTNNGGPQRIAKTVCCAVSPFFGPGFTFGARREAVQCIRFLYRNQLPVESRRCRFSGRKIWALRGR
jgi:hypothetical protein